jgi:hypothetical protein
MSGGRGNAPAGLKTPTPVPGRGDGCAELGAVFWALSAGELEAEDYRNQTSVEMIVCGNVNTHGPP